MQAWFVEVPTDDVPLVEAGLAFAISAWCDATAEGSSLWLEKLELGGRCLRQLVTCREAQQPVSLRVTSESADLFHAAARVQTPLDAAGSEQARALRKLGDLAAAATRRTPLRSEAQDTNG